jgi:hypothetical protein
LASEVALGDHAHAGGGVPTLPLIAGTEYHVTDYVAGTSGNGIDNRFFNSVPFVSQANAIYSQLAFNVETAGTLVCRVGIFTDIGRPGTLIQDLGTFSCASTGAKLVTISPALTMVAGTRVWIVLWPNPVSTATGNLRSAGQGILSRAMGVGSGAMQNSQHGNFQNTSQIGRASCRERV